MNNEDHPNSYGPGLSGNNESPPPAHTPERVGDNIPDSLKQAVIRAFVQRKSELMEKALEQMLFHSQPLNMEHQLRKGLIDTLLNAELHNRSIYADYVFGVFNPVKNGFTLITDETKEQELLTQGMLFTLFPSDMLANPDFLIIYFPSQRSYLLTQMWGLMAISIILMLVIILSFAYSISTIVRQKRFAEMKNDFINNMSSRPQYLP